MVALNPAYTIEKSHTAEKTASRDFFCDWSDCVGQNRLSTLTSTRKNYDTDTNYLYDNWNLIAEFDATESESLIKTYVWGLDLSQSMQGAGGVGGLLSVSDYAAEGSPAVYYYVYDGGGNVSDLVDESGLPAAHYEYSPFGQITSQSGSYAEKNKFRFSTKYQDETGLLYYGFRYYNADLARWINRDPMHSTFLPESFVYLMSLIESGEVSEYIFTLNEVTNEYDKLGLYVSGSPPSSAGCVPGQTANEPTSEFTCCLTCNKCKGDLIPCLDDCKPISGVQPVICETWFFGLGTRWTDNGDPYVTEECNNDGLSCGGDCTEGGVYIDQNDRWGW